MRTDRSVWVRSLLSLIKRTGIFCVAVLAIALAIGPLRASLISPTDGQSLRSAQLTALESSPLDSEVRGVWITNVASSVLFTPWGIARTIEQLADMQFNTVYPVVWNRGQTFYHSDRIKEITQRDISPLVGLLHPQEDPLAEMVRRGHQKGMRVIPWFEYGFMVPLQSRLAKAHPDWLTARENGTLRLGEDALAGGLVGETAEPDDAAARTRGLNRLLKSGAPTELGWLNPLHPSVQALILDLVDEVVSNYGVDGIQFDDHFSLPVEFGYDAFTVALYGAEHGGQLPPVDFADQDWLRWRAGKLSSFVKILHERVKETCPSCVFSLSPNPASYAYEYYAQDWGTWVENEWLDELVVQVYRNDLNQFAAELAKNTLQSVRDRIPVSIGILTGTWSSPIAFEQIKAQVVSSRDHHFSGVSFFYWDTLWSYFTPESPQQRRQNFRELLQEADTI
ncbi:glycoside hydrolase family 10 protein [cf. Phormidesmis sp. LEGE 11477]|uniref:glycoside hydrolase family 10 protein n=1 Tax=cf. Phormidesmis sp. LEGE 11477 TaxID=1828680 RepID=UPI00187FCCEA|nr:family 10 glycosylhydrolase [cf. Phormidesmis sp. LEGE 11477]MBE9064201.1 family 10 glycosylhydrolase [cf. Phormidesmis sp. LEGE 11477]